MSEINEDFDIYKQRASEIFNIPYEEVTPQQRRTAKSMTLASTYSTIDDELSSRIKLKTSEEKQDVIHVVHQKCFEGGDLNFYHIYLYKNLNDAEKFIAEKTGYKLEEVRTLLSTGDCIVRMDYFDYSIEEVEIL